MKTAQHMPFYKRRRRQNAVVMTLCIAAAAFGLLWLFLILFDLVYEGVSGLGVAVFTQMTPAPGASGGLLNAIVGSLIMTGLAVLIGAPIGILAGTYMAEYGRHTPLTHVVRFVNDILLSAPSIVIGLFVYELLVVTLGHFSGIAGAVALALIVLPVVVRTTEDMLLLVPDDLREAGRALGAPRSVVIRAVAYGVDLIAVNDWGLRASGIMPEDPAGYLIFGTSVLAPCAGRVVVVEGGRPDMPVPQMDESHPAGNHVLLRCGDHDILLAHFRQGSLRVEAGDDLAIGQQIAEVGNSGESSEPHLHIHAQRPGTPDAPFGGVPVSMRLEDRFLVRGDLVQTGARGQ